MPMYVLCRAALLGFAVAAAACSSGPAEQPNQLAAAVASDTPPPVEPTIPEAAVAEPPPKKYKVWKVGQRVCYNGRPSKIVGVSSDEVAVETPSTRYTMHPARADWAIDLPRKRPSGQRLTLNKSSVWFHSEPGVRDGEILRSDIRSNGDTIVKTGQRQVQGRVWYQVAISTECSDPILGDQSGWLRAADVN